jgi:hypothetical protein
MTIERKSGKGKEVNCIYSKKGKSNGRNTQGLKVRGALLSKHHIYPFQRPDLT